MIPKFSNWIENADLENPATQPNTGNVPDETNNVSDETENSNLSEPQHKKGEKFLTLNRLVEKRLTEIAEDLERTGKANKEQFLDSIKYFK